MLTMILSALLAAAGSVPERISYDIRASVDVERHVVHASARIVIPRECFAAPDVARLDLGAGGVDQSGAPRLTLEGVAGGTRADVAASTTLIDVRIAPEATAARLEVRWTMRLHDEVRAEMGYDAAVADAPGSYWYPDVVGGRAERARFRDFRVELETPSRVAVLTTGVLESKKAAGSIVRGTYVARHVEGFALNLGDGFALIEVDGHPTRVQALAPASERQTFQLAAEITARVCAWYEKTYGFFPLTQIGLAPGAMANYVGGFPGPNVFYLHAGNRSPEFLDWIIPHELGHCYWGLYVQSASWERLDWLMLANGIWADQLYQAQTHAKDLEEVWRGNDYTLDALAAQLAGREQRLGLSAAEEKGLTFDYNSEIRHGKGALGLWLQARRIGTERFLAIQRRLLTEYRDRALTLDDFTHRLEDAGAAGATEFFRAWTRGDAALSFEVAAVRSERTATGWRHAIDVVRRGSVGYPVTIEARGSDVSSVRGRLVGKEKRESIVLETDTPLTEVRLDPDGVLPMWNGAHPGVRRLYARALERAGLSEVFFVWGAEYLLAHPQDAELRSSLIDRMSSMRRCRAALELASRSASDDCRLALSDILTRARCGAAAEARSALDALEARCSALARTGSWKRAVDEVTKLAAPAPAR